MLVHVDSLGRPGRYTFDGGNSLELGKCRTKLFFQSRSEGVDSDPSRMCVFFFAVFVVDGCLVHVHAKCINCGKALAKSRFCQLCR